MSRAEGENVATLFFVKVAKKKKKRSKSKNKAKTHMTQLNGGKQQSHNASEEEIGNPPAAKRRNIATGDVTLQPGSVDYVATLSELEPSEENTHSKKKKKKSKKKCEAREERCEQEAGTKRVLDSSAWKDKEEDASFGGIESVPDAFPIGRIGRLSERSKLDTVESNKETRDAMVTVRPEFAWKDLPSHARKFLKRYL